MVIVRLPLLLEDPPRNRRGLLVAVPGGVQTYCTLVS